MRCLKKGLWYWYCSYLYWLVIELVHKECIHCHLLGKDVIPRNQPVASHWMFSMTKFFKVIACLVTLAASLFHSCYCHSCSLCPFDNFPVLYLWGSETLSCDRQKLGYWKCLNSAISVYSLVYLLHLLHHSSYTP